MDDFREAKSIKKSMKNSIDFLIDFDASWSSFWKEFGANFEKWKLARDGPSDPMKVLALLAKSRVGASTGA